MQYLNGGRITRIATFPYRFHRRKFVFKFLKWVWRVTGINEGTKKDLKQWISIFAPEGARKS